MASFKVTDIQGCIAASRLILRELDRGVYDEVEIMMIVNGQLDLSEQDIEIIQDALRDNGTEVAIKETTTGFTWIVNGEESAKQYTNRPEAERDGLIAGSKAYEKTIKL